ncbi:hypothetical protein EJB05_12945, partial [Eragrostis curvula]
VVEGEWAGREAGVRKGPCVVECFFCATCIAPEPHLAECREVLAKVGTLIVHLDDIYDVHGTLDELEAWCDVSEAALPEYMKAMYSAIVSTSVTAAGRVLEKQGYDVLPLYRKGWHELCKAFLVEARWQVQGIVPSFQEEIPQQRAGDVDGSSPAAPRPAYRNP